MTQGPLSADDIRRLFGDLASELDAARQRAEIFLVGGAAIALCFDARRATRDLDAVFAPTESVRRAAAVVAEREGLDPDWLNDAVKGFLPGPDPDAVRYFEAPGLLVDVASAEYLLAMKLFSSRVETDAEDIALLYREVGYQTVEEVRQGLGGERSGPGAPGRVPADLEWAARPVPPAPDGVDSDIKHVHCDPRLWTAHAHAAQPTAPGRWRVGRHGTG